MNAPAKAFGDFFSEIQKALGIDAVNRSDETILRYGENTMPGGDRPPAGIVYPGSTADVQAIVRAANKHHVPLSDLDRQQYRARQPLGVEGGAGCRRSRAAHEPHSRGRRTHGIRRGRARRQLSGDV